MKKLLKNIAMVMASICLTLLAIEAILRCLPVNEGLYTQPVNADAPILHFKKNRTSTWSRFADFSMVNSVHSNNYGFINDQDYTSNSTVPLIAVIGDSYVEAAMVPYNETFHGRLAKNFKGKWRVYSFGVSGAPLSQYLMLSQYAQKTFAPQKMIFVIITNDFDESLTQYKVAPGLHYFTKTSVDRLELTRINYAPTFATRILRHSRLMMYLFTNLNIQHTLSNLFAHAPPPASVGQTSAIADEKRLKLSQEAIKEFFKLLPLYTTLEKSDILFIVDGLRPHLYSESSRLSTQGSYASLMRNFFLEAAHANSYQTIDLTSYFMNDYKKHKHRFEFERDGHWNSYAHGLIAQILTQRFQ